MSRTRALAAAIAAACVVLTGGGASAVPPVDQQSDPGDGVAGFCDASVGQGFIANVTGRLTRLDVFINRSTLGDPGDLTFDLRSVDLDDGLPTATVLASATIANGDIPVGPQIAWRSLTFDPAPAVIAGWWYAITTDAPDCDQPGDSGFGWGLRFDDAYPRGSAVYAESASGPWVREDRDQAFRTYVRRATPVFQPDVVVAPAGSGPWIGSDLYDWDGWTERIEVSVDPGDRVTYRVRVQNDGTRPATFVVRGVASDTDFRIRYLKGATGTTDITRAITAGSYRIGPLEPGTRRTLRIVITARASAQPGAERGVALTATSVSRPKHRDGLRIVLTVE